MKKNRKPVTAWARFADVGRRFEHNHIEDGHAKGGVHEPTPKFPEQARSWKGALWTKKLGYLVNGVFEAK